MKLKILRIVLIILLLGIFYIIFGFSSQNGEKSSGLSKKVTEMIVEKILKTSKEDKPRIMNRLEGIIRKLAHFSIYTILGLLLMGLISTYNIEEKKRIYITMIIGILYASSDEIHQSFIPGRSAQVTDVMIDTMGVALGMCLILLLLKIVVTKKHKNVKYSCSNNE